MKRGLRALGYDIVQFPMPTTHAGNLAAIISRFEVNRVLDVGAHVGETGILLRKLGYRGPITSFEPAEESFALLEGRAARDKLWTARRLALGSKNELRRLTVRADSWLSSFLPPNELGDEFFGKGVVKDREEVVEVVRLDAINDVVADDVRDPRIFLKVDAQGWDLEVLRGAEGVLSSVVALQFEASWRRVYDGTPEFFELVSFARHRGFEVSGLYPVSRDERLRMVDFDCLMVRSAAAVATP